MSQQRSVILRLYFVLVAFVTLMLLIFSISDLINISLKTWIFTAADQPSYVSCDYLPNLPPDEVTTEEQTNKCTEYQKQEIAAEKVRKQKNAIRDISLIIVSLPLFLLHFRIVIQDWRDEHDHKKE